MSEGDLKQRTTHNRSKVLSHCDVDTYRKRLLTLNKHSSVEEILNKTQCEDVISVLNLQPDKFVDLVFDPFLSWFGNDLGGS